MSFHEKYARFALAECGNQALSSVAALAVGATVLTAVIRLGSEVVRETQDRAVAVLSGEEVISDTATSTVASSPGFGKPLSMQAVAGEIPAEESFEEQLAHREAYAKQISRSFRTAIQAAVSQSNVAVVPAPPSPENPVPEQSPASPTTAPSPGPPKPEPTKDDPPKNTTNPIPKDPVKSSKPGKKPKPKDGDDTDEDLESPVSQNESANTTSLPSQGSGATPAIQPGNGFPSGPLNTAPMFGGSFGAPTATQQPYSATGQIPAPAMELSPPTEPDNLSALLGLLTAERPPAEKAEAKAKKVPVEGNIVPVDARHRESGRGEKESLRPASSVPDNRPTTAVSALLDSVISPSPSVQSQTQKEPRFKKSEAITVTTVDRSEPGMPRLHIICRKPFRQIHVEGGGHNLAFNAPLPGQPRSIPLDAKMLEPGTTITIIGIEETTAELFSFVVPSDQQTESPGEQLAITGTKLPEMETTASVQPDPKPSDPNNAFETPLAEQ
jgi:hypothetical protein